MYLIGQNFGGQKCQKSDLLPKILSAENFSPPKILSAEILSDKVYELEICKSIYKQFTYKIFGYRNSSNLVRISENNFQFLIK